MLVYVHAVPADPPTPAPVPVFVPPPPPPAGASPLCAKIFKGNVDGCIETYDKAPELAPVPAVEPSLPIPTLTQINQENLNLKN